MVARPYTCSATGAKQWSAFIISCTSVVRWTRSRGGVSPFGSWADHVTAWRPEARPNTLFLRYEDLVCDLGTGIDQIAAYLKVEPLRRSMPPREDLAKLDGHWIRSEDAPRATLDGEALARFWEVNGEVMRAYGYH